ncbi:regulatory protein YycH of two-component signal transduction system YycFG [Enterococcus sp. PF1-24]|uniref:YycH family regulatory protein n=1 Tax=unclassified Enterococcus TaxID=2608891 RepID=UPI0024736FD1|nr:MULTISPECIES: hypothetical protein [unclassified Enterococcus]MDH6363571.1 regulatory protein YycH of two-component signal transduction system YycFG [Enterococcus sp. PFB1-1]MDH6400806.1 regulatory protein YycH of two-component signal transduction system YycFG [Enterococcus sp. PF1-24]
MKISERFVRLLLVSLIGLSLYFSYNIWLSPAHTKRFSTDTKQLVTENQNYRKMTDTFLPLQLAWLQEDTIKGTQSENLISQVQEQLAKDTVGVLAVVVYQNEKDFAEYLQISEGIELLYESPFSLAEYLKIYHFDIKDSDEAENYLFSKVQIDFTNQQVNFMNVKEHTVYQLAFSGKADKYQQIMAEKMPNLLDVTRDNTYNLGRYNIDESISLKKYSYILSTQSFTLFSNAFFQDVENVNNETNSVYSSGEERLTVNAGNIEQLVDFRGQLPLETGLDNVYTQSFDYVKKLGTNFGNLRYFDRDKNTVNYRFLVEGYPVFSEFSQGLLSVTADSTVSEDSKAIHIQGSTNTIQVPIPSDEVAELQPTATIKDELLAAGVEESEISSIIIGYTWESIEGNTRVVNLTPEWYVCYSGTWYQAEKLIQQSQVKEAD